MLASLSHFCCSCYIYKHNKSPFLNHTYLPHHTTMVFTLDGIKYYFNQRNVIEMLEDFFRRSSYEGGHFTNALEGLTGVVESSSVFGQATNDSGALVATHRGNFTCKYQGIDGNLYPLTLTDVHYCPDLHTPLLCFSKLANAFGNLDCCNSGRPTILA
jgi:hypothetical protein